MSDKFGVAAIQLCSGFDVTVNLSEAGRLIDEAAAMGADYIQTPEMTPLFVTDKKALFDPELVARLPEIIDFFAQKAKQHQTMIHLGSMAIPFENEMAANRSFLFGTEGELIASYDKIHLFDAEIEGDQSYRESDTYIAGEVAVLAETKKANIGLSICYDVRFPSLYNNLAQQGAHILAVPAAFTVPTGRAHWETLLKARAIETGCFVVASAQTGTRGTNEPGRERQTYGHAMIVDAWGKIHAQMGEEVGFIHAEIDLNRVEKFQKKLPNLANGRQFSLSINHVVPE